MLIELLSRESGLRLSQLARLAETASNRYFEFAIPKRTGGQRQIVHPARPLKAIQRWLNRRLIANWQVHENSMAYGTGCSIRRNAERHQNTLFTLRIDLENFFPSFTSQGVHDFIEARLDEPLLADPVDRTFFLQCVMKDGRLTIGAPTSPLLTNVLMHEVDAVISSYCEENNLVYTRYADDLFLSAFEPNKLEDALQYVSGRIEAYPFAQLAINDEKTSFLSRRYRRSVTGLVITPDHQISIGRARKREIRALILRSVNGVLEEERVGYLQGLLAFALDAEPSLRGRLEAKYGVAAIECILA